jgi:uncharacterized delta-60 repeat protein
MGGNVRRIVVPAVMAVAVVSAWAGPAAADAGDLDPAFGGGDGQVVTSMGVGDAYGNATVVQKDGRVLVAGTASHATDDTEFAVVRYKPNGSPDPTFGGDGRVVTNLTGGDDQPYGVALAGGGKILVGGYAGENFAAVRYLPDGTLDHTFSGDGKAIIHFSQGPSFGYSIARSKGGKVVIGGLLTVNGVDRFALVRLTSAGVLDAAFGGDGRVATPMGAGNAFVWQMLVHADGSIVAVGDANPSGGHTSAAVAWYHPNGTLDSGFGDGGKTIHDVGEDLSPSGLVELASHKIVIAGAYRTGPASFMLALLRLRADGHPDETFGPDALVTRDFGGDGDYVGEIRRAGSKFLVSMSHNEGAASHMGVARLNANGSADTAFGNQGLALVTKDGTFGQALAVDGDGRIVVAGQLNSPAKFFTARFLPA